MKPELFAIIALAAAVAAFGAFSPTAQRADGPQAAAWQTRVSEEGEVTVAVTPLELAPGAKEWKFAVALNTHSVELDDDLVRAAVLVDEGGIEHEPIAWEGSPPGGHHREGVLLFNPVEPSPRTIEIKIRGVGGVPERSFSWDLN